ncbi:MAG: ZIP family metal transporter, partial [Clostridiales bacterium]|nr:ZIP family metal transporter [Clostridiales bacterium]
MTSETFTWILLFATGAMVVNSAGIWLVYNNIEWAHKNKKYFMCFAAGVLISSPLLIAFPEAIEKNSGAGFAALLGFVFLFFSNKLIEHRTGKPSLAFGITALQGIGIHSFIDGIIYTVAFSVNIYTGLLAGVGLVAHEFAEGVITFSVLSAGGFDKRKAGILAFFVAALTTPAGALLSYPFVSRLSDPLLGMALGFVVGVLIYLSAS